MALIVITVQDTPNGATVALAAEPPMDMSKPPEGDAQMLAHKMLGALPINQPGDVALVEPSPQSRWRSTEDTLPPDKTPVIVLLRGVPDIGELRWDHPGHEDTYEAYRYWDNPNDDGKCWDWGDITHWMPLPDAPPALVTELPE